MKGKKINRRICRRLKIDKSVRVPVQISPQFPFIGSGSDAVLLNISSGGMALGINSSQGVKGMKKGSIIRVHFNLPGHPFQQCRGKLTHFIRSENSKFFLGVKFIKPPKSLIRILSHMAEDDASCNRRIREQSNPWCDINCSFHHLCRKPIRVLSNPTSPNHIEIAIQTFDMAPAA